LKGLCRALGFLFQIRGTGGQTTSGVEQESSGTGKGEKPDEKLRNGEKT